MSGRAILSLLTAVVACLALVAMAGCTDGSAEAEGDQAERSGSDGLPVDLIYLNHPPVRPVIAEVERVLETYEKEIDVRRYDAETSEGRQRAQELGLSGHIAVAIALDGDVEAEVGGRTVRFDGFPSGSSPIASMEGSWSVQDLEAALEQRLR